MPFSFKPDVTAEAPQAGQPAPQTAFGNPIAPTAAIPAERIKSEGTSFVEIVLFALFGFTILVFVGLFAYKFYLSSQIEAKKAALAGYEDRLKNIPIEDMRKLSNRLKMVNQLVKEHPSVNVAFLIVEASIEHMVTFNRFELRYVENTKSYQLTLGGVAPDYKSIAQQLDAYKMKPYSTYIPKVSLESLSPDPAGKILFSVKMPIAIRGFIPEKFPLMSGTPNRTAATSSDTSAVKATTTPGVGENTNTTAQAGKP